MARRVGISVTCSDVSEYKADALVLKYAQNLYGADGIVYNLLVSAGIQVELPIEREWRGVRTKGTLAASAVIFVGVAPLFQFGYEQIREFARTAISAAADVSPTARELAMTIHGPGYGLDPIEAFESEVAGIFDGLKTGRIPRRLERITFVERDSRRASDLASRLKLLVPAGSIELDDGGHPHRLSAKSDQIVRSAGYGAATKPLLFVAMPYKKEMTDVFEFGILRPAKKCGFICERADTEWFNDDIVARVKDRIAHADIVLADLTGANPNVFLELGYSWGQNRPTILIAQKSPEPLPIDVRSHNCIVYESLKELEGKVKIALKASR
jgi:hypothetical protein